MVKSIKDEFIGSPVEIVNSYNRQLIGLKGKIVDETKNAFKVLVKKTNYQEFKLIFKQNTSFKIGNKIFDGNKIMKKSEERIKLKDKN
jgi:RNase P/RNase MRP subunit p29